jgi:hypothetical protein
MVRRKQEFSSEAEGASLRSNHRLILILQQSTLEFDLRLQEYIELARDRRTTDAIAYARKHLIPWQETHLMQIQQASALLAFSRNTTCNPYRVSVVSETSLTEFLSLELATVRPESVVEPHPVVSARDF